ncbi:SulP family inorganic anion transporter [Nocardiopsis sp. YSL2]|uniref:SulP family inorganic anion transporter n=1 Tax=Nocardiopsis sp. YSL2 TaxID=2939492 RepID=UPI0026F44ED3|nr:sulfate permease [Nocardiopsis sp. YSL2]
MSSSTVDYPLQRRTGAARFLPLLGWFGQYTRATLRADVVAGLTVAVMLVPQSMAYAALAGMPPATGLYAAVVPLVVYALLGTSGSLAVGPVAITALMSAAALAPLADGDPARYAALAGVLALLVGAIQFSMGALRLGAVVNFMSHPVLSGFTSAAAIIIAASQLKDLLGLRAERAGTLPETILALAGAVTTAHWPTIAVSAVSVLALVLLKRVFPKVPGALLVVAAVTGLSAVLSFGDRGVAVLGEVPAGLPMPAVPDALLGDVVALLPAALAIALVGYMEGIAVAKALAAKSRQHVSADTELVAVGAANGAAGLFGAFPVAGGFSRSAVNFSAGARTPVATLVTAAVVAVTALVLTPAFYHLPKAVLAAIVVVAVAGLVDLRGAATVWRTRRLDGFALGVTFLVTLLFGVEPGIAAGVVFSLAVVLWNSSRPHTAELGRVPGTGTFRNVDRYEGLTTDPGIAVVRVDAPLYFANAQWVTDTLVGIADERAEVRTIVLDASAISDCDSDGAHALSELHRTLDSRGIELRLATVRGPVRDVLTRDGIWAVLRGARRVHPDVVSAVTAAGGGAPAPELAREVL